MVLRVGLSPGACGLGEERSAGRPPWGRRSGVPAQRGRTRPACLRSGIRRTKARAMLRHPVGVPVARRDASSAVLPAAARASPATIQEPRSRRALWWRAPNRTRHLWRRWRSRTTLPAWRCRGARRASHLGRHEGCRRAIRGLHGARQAAARAQAPRYGERGPARHRRSLPKSRLKSCGIPEGARMLSLDQLHDGG